MEVLQQRCERCEQARQRPRGLPRGRVALLDTGTRRPPRPQGVPGGLATLFASHHTGARHV